jgi:hypothetical protein
VRQNLLPPEHPELGPDQGPFGGIRRSYVGKSYVDARAIATRVAAMIRRRRTRPAVGAAILCLASVGHGLALRGDQQKASAYQIEAVYLYDFSKFVEWPAATGTAKSAPFNICILGQDPFGATLDTTLSGERVEGANLAARRIAEPRDAEGCKIVFVSDSEENRLKAVLDQLEGGSALTVSDIRDFSQRGGMVQFVVANGKVRFEVNVKNAADAGLTFSAELLEVALAVRKA